MSSDSHGTKREFSVRKAWSAAFCMTPEERENANRIEMYPVMSFTGSSATSLFNDFDTSSTVTLG